MGQILRNLKKTKDPHSAGVYKKLYLCGISTLVKLEKQSIFVWKNATQKTSHNQHYQNTTFETKCQIHWEKKFYCI